MGSICGSEASHGSTSEELLTLQSNLDHYKNQTKEFQARLKQTQEELKMLSAPSEPIPEANSGEEVERLKELLNAILREGWSQLRALEKALECEEKLRDEQEKEGLNNIEEVEEVLQKRSTHRKDLCQKLCTDRESIRNITTTFWFKLEAHYRTVGKQERLTDSLPKHDYEIADSLDRLLSRFSGLCQEYITLAANAREEPDETKLSRDLDTVREKKNQFETALAQLEERNKLLANQVAELKTATAGLQTELRVATAANAELSVKNKEIEEHVVSLEEDLSIKRSLLVHVKGELAAAERKNKKLRDDLEAVRARQSDNQLASEMNSLEEQKKALASEIIDSEQEIAAKQETLKANKKKIAQLEESLRESEEKPQNSGEIDVRMLNMQSTLQELYKSIEDNGEDEDF